MSNHHAAQVEVARPVRAQGLWFRWRHERRCGKTLSHCWHPADAMIAWFCCVCGGETDGMPPQRCRICTGAAS